ncbi:MAG: hypothetical protein FJX72_02265 [Armatimonadetes bacterium]|nr:hypothetical protein [Armatimonadota bacterium]
MLTHYLHHEQNNPASKMNLGAGETDWSACVVQLDVAHLAKTLADVGAGYHSLILMQGRRFMSAPNPPSTGSPEPRPAKPVRAGTSRST